MRGLFDKYNKEDLLNTYNHEVYNIISLKTSTMTAQSYNRVLQISSDAKTITKNPLFGKMS